MGLNDFTCEECGFTDEFYTNVGSLPKDMCPPEVCPKCGKGKMVKQFNLTGKVFIRRNWKEGKTSEQIADLLNPDPVTGKYKDPY